MGRVTLVTDVTHFLTALRLGKNNVFSRMTRHNPRICFFPVKSAVGKCVTRVTPVTDGAHMLQRDGRWHYLPTTRKNDPFRTIFLPKLRRYFDT
jgi:hypothetical protein